MENHAKYGDSIYFHATADGKDALFVNLFIPSTLKWKEKGIELKQLTQFPESGKTRLEITAAKPTEFALNIRQPAWCKAVGVTVNGTPEVGQREPGKFISINRTWKSGDVVEIDLPMTLRTERLPGSENYVAIAYGPIALVGELGKEGIAPGADIHINERTIGEVLNDRVEIPTFVGKESELLEKIKPLESPLTFKTEGLGRPSDVTLIPYYRVAHERYNMYWKLIAPDS